MRKILSRRDFLKLTGLAFSSLAFTLAVDSTPTPTPAPPPAPFSGPEFPIPLEQDQGKLARVTIKQIDLRSAPDDKAPIIGQRYRDQIVHIYAELHPANAPAYYNTLWYRVWGGYLHSAHLQLVPVRLNEPVNNVPESGLLSEVTVPYTTAYQYSTRDGWYPWRGSRLYFETTHWATDVILGPDRQPWYQLTSELSKTEKYLVPARHLRMIPPQEIAPLSTDVPADKKHIEVSINEQTLRAYEYNRLVFSTKVSTGIPTTTPAGEFPTATPRGRFNIYSKLPNKHMGSVTGNPDDENRDRFSLPGVPWTCFFDPNGGVAFHGTYWHNNFGLQMSHGCVNMRNADAKWLFRWTTPVYDTEITSQKDWERTGKGTEVVIT